MVRIVECKASRACVTRERGPAAGGRRSGESSQRPLGPADRKIASFDAHGRASPRKSWRNERVPATRRDTTPEARGNGVSFLQRRFPDFRRIFVGNSLPLGSSCVHVYGFLLLFFFSFPFSFQPRRKPDFKGCLTGRAVCAELRSASFGSRRFCKLLSFLLGY